MIKYFEMIPTTQTSYPQAAAPACCKLENYGYVEEEYFFHGTANVYALKEQNAAVQYENTPYVNRLLIRRPKEPAKASGRVVVEILNATSGMDIDRMWAITHRLFLRNGDTYVGITSKPSSIRAMQKLDPQRYESLHWNNPMPRYLPQVLKERHAFCGAISEESEAGLIWDMLSDLGTAIRERTLPLGDIQPRWVYLMGWSQSTIYMVLYLNYFAYSKGVSPYDGYFSGGGVRSLAPGLNQYDLPECAGEYGTYLHRVSEPYIAVQTESENHALGNDVVIQGDSDDPNFRYRIYDIPGATHDNEFTMAEYYRGNRDVHKLGIILTYPAKDPYPNNYPYQFVFHRACDMLYRWTELGESPKRMDRIMVGFNGQNVRDFCGNAVGGWRLPPIDFPVCTYYPFPETIEPTAFSLYGSRYPFSPERLRELYGSLEQYETKVRQSAAEAVADGRLMEEDREACVSFCVAEAHRYGLL